MHRRKFEDQVLKMFALLTLLPAIALKFLRIPVRSTDRRQKGARSDAEAIPKELVSCKKRFAAFLSVTRIFSDPC